ncbi:MAG: hypothetical protein AB1578_22200, partial [Thermodesulfobacteriota bacterium]
RDPRGYFGRAPVEEGPEVFAPGARGGRREQELRFPGYRARFSLPKGAAAGRRVPAVVILPISKGDSQAEAIGEFLSAYGFACLRMVTPREVLAVDRSPEPVEEFRRRFRAYVAAVLGAVEWMAARPQVDPQRLGLVGISFGAVAGAVVSGVEPRIRASALLLGGGDLAGIFLSSEDRLVRRVRFRLEEHTGASGRELEGLLREELRFVEPLSYAPGLDPERVLLVNAAFDRVIARPHTLALWKAAGKPRLYLVPSGHYTAIAFLPYASRLTLLHLQRSLGP